MACRTLLVVQVMVASPFAARAYNATQRRLPRTGPGSERSRPMTACDANARVCAQRIEPQFTAHVS